MVGLVSAEVHEQKSTNLILFIPTGSGPLTVGEFGGTRCTLVSASDPLDCGTTGALLRHPALPVPRVREPDGGSSLGVKPAAEEAARMVLGALVDPEPVAPSGITCRVLRSAAGLSLEEALEDVTGCATTGSDVDRNGNATSDAPWRRARRSVDCSSISSASPRGRRFFLSDKISNL